MVLECRSADTGVGATIAPTSHAENGSWAALVSPAKPMRAAGTSAMTFPLVVSASSPIMPLPNIASQMIAPANAMPPSRFIQRARKALLVASSVFVYPIRRKEQSVVTSQKK